METPSAYQKVLNLLEEIIDLQDIVELLPSYIQKSKQQAIHKLLLNHPQEAAELVYSIAKRTLLAYHQDCQKYGDTEHGGVLGLELGNKLVAIYSFDLHDPQYEFISNASQQAIEDYIAEYPQAGEI